MPLEKHAHNEAERKKMIQEMDTIRDRIKDLEKEVFIKKEDFSTLLLE